VVGETFAPVEVIVAGRAGERITKRAGVKCVGFVETEARFYDTVDFAITPVFDGAGFKVRMADALALRAPSLLRAHAAEGAVIDPCLVCKTPADMAAKMAEIAIKRPPLGDAMTHVRRARHELRERVRRTGEHLLSAMAEASQPKVVSKYMPLGVKAMWAEDFAVARPWPVVTVIDVFVDTDRTALGLWSADAVVHDQRWCRCRAPDRAIGVLGEMPLLH
jgi:hypothetical protein